MKILVTGANGYLGKGIVDKLIQLGIDIIATDCMDTDWNLETELKVADIFELSNPFEAFGKPDVLLHLAWKNGFQHNHNSHIEDLPKHFKFIKDLVDGGLKQVAIMGSMHEVGFYEGSINENTPANPQNYYGIAKDSLRKSIEVLQQEKDIKLQWIRGFYIVGNSPRGSSVFAKIVAAVREGKREFPFTTGQNQYDFLDYEDFCAQVAAVVTQSEILGIINCCSGRPEKLCDRVERFIKENNYDIILKYGSFPDRKYDSLAIWGNNTKINQIMDKRFREEKVDE